MFSTEPLCALAAVKHKPIEHRMVTDGRKTHGSNLPLILGGENDQGRAVQGICRDELHGGGGHGD